MANLLERSIINQVIFVLPDVRFYLTDELLIAVRSVFTMFLLPMVDDMHIITHIRKSKPSLPPIHP